MHSCGMWWSISISISDCQRIIFIFYNATENCALGFVRLHIWCSVGVIQVIFYSIQNHHRFANAYEFFSISCYFVDESMLSIENEFVSNFSVIFGSNWVVIYNSKCIKSDLKWLKWIKYPKFMDEKHLKWFDYFHNVSFLALSASLNGCLWI